MGALQFYGHAIENVVADNVGVRMTAMIEWGQWRGWTPSPLDAPQQHPRHVVLPPVVARSWAGGGGGGGATLPPGPEAAVVTNHPTPNARTCACRAAPTHRGACAPVRVPRACAVCSLPLHKHSLRAAAVPPAGDGSSEPVLRGLMGNGIQPNLRNLFLDNTFPGAGNMVANYNYSTGYTQGTGSETCGG